MRPNSKLSKIGFWSQFEVLHKSDLVAQGPGSSIAVEHFLYHLECAMTLSITKLSITALSIEGLFVTISIKDIQHKGHLA